MPSLHISAEKNEIAKHVIMPGDPLRAKFMAEQYLENPKQINQVRNMFGFTGYYNGKPVTIMGSGMGVPSIGIYTHELFAYYEVQKIIRVGTCGAVQSSLNLGDLVMAQSISTDSSYLAQFGTDGVLAPTASWHLLKNAHAYCEKKSYEHQVGNVLCTDIFYHHNKESWKSWAKMGVLAIEMESVALYANAAYFGQQALTILTVSDQILHEKRSSSQERERSFGKMFEIALHAIQD